MAGMTDDDIRAFGPAPAAAPKAPLLRRRRWRWWLFGTLVALLSMAWLLACAVGLLIDALDPATTISIDGQRWELASLRGTHVLGLVFALLIAAAVVLVVVPLVVLLALLCAALCVGVALLAVLGSLALALSPLWLLVLLLWLLLRPARRPAATSS